MLALSSESAVLAAIAVAKRVEVDAYMLGSAGLIRALEDAAARGAGVTVRLCADPYRSDGLARANARLAERLRADGIDARLVPEEHAKTVRADGATFYDDCNWRASDDDTILRDDVPDDPGVATTKGAALELERRLLAGAERGDRIDVETESFGNGPISGALARAARAGACVRLLVDARELRRNARERAAISAMRRAGVVVRATDATEKFAVTDAGLWLGSANATYGAFDQSDWGTLAATAARSRCSAAFERRWSEAEEAPGVRVGAREDGLARNV